MRKMSFSSFFFCLFKVGRTIEQFAQFLRCHFCLRKSEASLKSEHGKMVNKLTGSQRRLASDRRMFVDFAT